MTLRRIAPVAAVIALALASIALLGIQAAHADRHHRDGRFLDTDNHGVLVNADMPKCADDLGRPCIVYVPQNGLPANSYWKDAAGNRHWFWSTNPVAGHHPPNHWTDDYGTSLSDSLHAKYPSQANRDWDRCWFELIPSEPAVVNCPDGSDWIL